MAEIDTTYPRNYCQHKAFSYILSDFTLTFNIAMNVAIVHPRYDHTHSVREYALGDTEEGKDVVVNQILPQ